MKDLSLWIVRLAIVGGGGALVSKGFIQADDLEVFAGAGVAAVGAIWSHYERKKMVRVGGGRR